MSQLHNIVKELREISNQISVLGENKEWDLFDEIVEMIRLFGKRFILMVLERRKICWSFDL